MQNKPMYGGGDTINGNAFNGNSFSNNAFANGGGTMFSQNTAGSTMLQRPGRGGKTQMDQLPSFGQQSNYPMARALYDCEAEEPDELTFYAGANIEILNMEHSEWWVGRLNGVTGNVPSCYVELL